jgi:hypothetical protein
VHRGKASGRYSNYLAWLTDVSHACGFAVEREVLRIPSTKNVAFVGRHRVHAATDVAAWVRVEHTAIRGHLLDSVRAFAARNEGVAAVPSPSSVDAVHVVSSDGTSRGEGLAVPRPGDGELAIPPPRPAGSYQKRFPGRPSDEFIAARRALKEQEKLRRQLVLHPTATPEVRTAIPWPALAIAQAGPHSDKLRH